MSKNFKIIKNHQTTFVLPPSTLHHHHLLQLLALPHHDATKSNLLIPSDTTGNALLMFLLSRLFEFNHRPIRSNNSSLCKNWLGLDLRKQKSRWKFTLLIGVVSRGLVGVKNLTKRGSRSRKEILFRWCRICREIFCGVLSISLI